MGADALAIPLRILLVHNYYGTSAPSGENLVFEAERELLRSRGHVVAEVVRNSDSLRASGVAGLLRGALATPWNPFSAAVVRRAVKTCSPDVVHVHNTFPLLSPAVFHAVPPSTATVLTLHNYRLFCPAGIPLRSGRICTECLDRRSVVPALRHGCYRGSRAATLPLAASVALHRTVGTWRRRVDAFIALTEFQRERMVEAGLPAGRVFVKPNFFPGAPSVVPWRDRGPYAVFAGRLTPEKGVETLVRAWLAWGRAAPELRILGDGPLRGRLEALARTGPARIAFHGRVPAHEAVAQVGHAKLAIVPSICYEAFPVVVCEAFALGTPVAASALGPLPSIVEDGGPGALFRPGDEGSLRAVAARVWDEPGCLERMGGRAREEFEGRYTEQATHDALMRIYRTAVDAARERR